jgi:hypothetical protein
MKKFAINDQYGRGDEPGNKEPKSKEKQQVI